MGDMADAFNEQVEDAEERRLDYQHGLLNDVEAYEEGVIDEHGELSYGGNTQSLTCRCCKTSGLRWQKVDGKWLMFDGDQIHDCPVNPL